MLALVVVSVVSFLASPSPALAGPCAIPPLSASPMTVEGTAIPPDGGVLVALGSGFGLWDQPSQTLDSTGWQFIDGGTKHAPVVTTLAPGLAVFRVPPGKGKLGLADAKRTLVTVDRVADAMPRLPAPAVAAIVHTRHAPASRRASERSTVIVKLRAARPATAVALILWEDKATTAASWVSITGLEATARAIEVFRTPDRCEARIPGLAETPPGKKVSVAWVDAHGRVGARSKMVVVGKGKPAR